MFTSETLRSFETRKTPFYFYDLNLLRQTLQQLKTHAERYNFHVHYAMKANANPQILEVMKEFGLGTDCVSGNEVKRSVESGFTPREIVFAGVGKSDEEINYALDKNIFCFNCESIQELEVIDELAGNKGVRANVAIRINPNVNANTHKYITTGLEENKFGINPYELAQVIEKWEALPNLWLHGLHFHIGSQITDLSAFKNLCVRVNEFYSYFENKQFRLSHINVGGGLGINYKDPDDYAIPDFAAYFKVFDDFLDKKNRPEIHFELGRAIVAQCGSLISRVLFIKEGVNTNFAILDAGMTELLRPALYQAYHKIENLSGTERKSPVKRYDVVGPICESADCFGKAVDLPETRRGDIIALRSAGAYGEVMASTYNLRDLVGSYSV